MVNDAATLAAALAAMPKQGGVIELAPGSYGDLVLDQTSPQGITLRSALPQQAIFADINLVGAENQHFDGISAAKFSLTQKTRHITLTGATIHGLLYVKSASDVVIEGNDIDGDLHAVLLNSIHRFVVRGNRIHDATEDLMRITGDSAEGVIEENQFYDMHPEDHRAAHKGYNHADAIQMFGVKGVTPNHIIIRRNHIYDDPKTGAETTTPQGIFLSDPAPDGYRDILIAENLICVRSPNSIYINGGKSNVVVRNNTLIPGAGDSGAVIRVVDRRGLGNAGLTITGNVMKALEDKAHSAKIGRNYIYGRNMPLERLFSGDGKQWQDFVPQKGTRFEIGLGYGAQAYLTDLLAGR